MRLRKFLISFSALLHPILFSVPAFANTVGRIVLKGRVPPRAQIILPVAPVTFVANDGSSGDNSAVVKIGNLINTPSGAVVKLESDNPAANSEPALTADDGTVIPYGVTVDGKPVTFSDGEAEIATLLRGQSVADSEVEFQAPKAAKASGHALSDHLVLVVTAR
jgi:hypothetical protein